MAYLEKYGVDIGEWNLKSFKTPLDFHLNQRFSLKNVLIFSKYYTYFHQCRLRTDLSSLNKPFTKVSEAEKYRINARVFNNSNLVDMRSTFGFLVQNLGTKQAIDPTTKDDALWRIIDFFTKAGISDISSFGSTNFNTINDKDIAQYFQNRLADSK